ncbi:MAG: heparinase II/III family protein [Acidobacteriota bacterium]
MPRSLRLVPILALALAALPAAHAAVSTLHPRIYVRNDAARVGRGLTLAQFRARLHQPEYARWRSGEPTGGAAGIVERAARYLESGDARDLAAVRDFLLTRTFSYEKHDVGGFLAGAEMATAFDWVYAGLTASERSAAAANIVTTADSSLDFLRNGQPDINHNYTYMALASVAIAGLALDGEPAPHGASAREYLETAREFLEAPGKVIDTWNAREGAWAEGGHYTFHETLRNLVLLLQAYRTASDTDYFLRIDMAAAGRFLIACTRPDLTFERTGDTSPSRALAALTVPLTVEMLAAGVPAAQDAAHLRSFADALVERDGGRAVHASYGWGMRIFGDARASRTPSYRTLPLAMRLGAGAYEQIMFRNGWDPGSTLVTILGGSHFTDHQHFDKGQFLIYHRGGLAIDSGAYDGMYQPGRHSNEYAQRTLAHNCLLVYDPAQQWPKGYTNDGGQLVLRGIQHHATWPEYLAHRNKEGLDAAEVTAFDHAAAYDYVRVNLQRAYGPKVTSYDRQFVYLPAPDFLVVFDRVTAADAQFDKRWLLHFSERPRIEGRLTVERRNEGTLFVETLLPEDPAITAVGGPGYEFYNPFTGINYPVSRPEVAAEPRESGAWRIEVAPRRRAQSDLFLHALQMADGAAAAPVPTRLVSSDQATGVHFLSQAGNQVVVFAAAPPFTYEVSSSAPALHTLVELLPGLPVTVEVNGKRLRPSRANSQGVLSFRDAGTGTRRIAIRPPH